MAVALHKTKKGMVRNNFKSRDLALGVSMLTLSGFRICQMPQRQLMQTVALKQRLGR